jgi:hypothetical protein
MRFLKVLLPVLVFGILALAPHPAFAAEATFFGPIVPPECHCDAAQLGAGKQSAPDFKCVLATMQNVVNFAISIGVIIFVLVCAYAGFLFMFSSINAENKSKAKNILTNAVVGLLLALAAWLLVDFIMKTLYNEKWGPWNSILGNAGNMCLTTTTPPTATGSTGAGDGVTTVTPPDTGTTGSTPSGIPANGSVTQAGGSCAGNTAACGPNLRCGTSADGANKDRCISTGTATASTFRVGDSVECTRTGTTYSAGTVASVPNIQVASSLIRVTFASDNATVEITASKCRARTTTASCPVPALTRLTDPLALRMESGETVIWDGTDSRLRTCANKFIAAAGGGSVNSAFRPAPYQTHLWEIRDRWCTQELRSNTNSACSSLKSSVSSEVTKHGLSSCGAVGATSRHTAGTGVDIRLTSGNYSGTAQLATESCLVWANYDGDPWHYNLMANCSCQ